MGTNNNRPATWIKFFVEYLEPNINVDAASIHLIFRAQLEEAKQRNRHEALYETEDEARSFYCQFCRCLTMHLLMYQKINVLRFN